MPPSLPEPQPGYRWELQVPEGPPHRRRPWGWVVGVVIVVVLLAGACFAGEWLARDVATKTIRGAVTQQLDLPADHEIEVELQGSVLLQSMLGRLNDVTVSSADLPLAGVSADVRVHATGVSIRGEDGAETADATVSFDTAQLQALLGTMDGFPADTVALEGPDITMTASISVLGAAFDLGVALTPSAVDGDLVLTPNGFVLGDAQIEADALRDRFGSAGEKLLTPWTMCVAEHLPSGMTLTGAEVEDERLVTTFDVEPGIIDDPELQAFGTCD